MVQRSKFFNTVQKILLILVLATTLFTGSAAVQAKGGAPALFSDAGDINGADISVNAPEVIRSRMVSLNLGALLDGSGKALDAAALPEINFNLFPDANFTGVVNKVTTGETTSWTGPIKNVKNGYFYLVGVEGAYIVHVATPKGIYEVSSTGTGLYKVVQIDQSKLGEDAPGQMEPSGPVLSKAEVSAAADSGAIIDVMVLYTSTARAAEGSVAGMKARIALAVTETNQSYANAGVTPRLRLVHTEEVSYAESGDIGVDVGRLAGTSDGYIDGIHAIRNAYAADMVSLVVENGGGYCGMADAIMATAATAFQVTARSGCMTGYYSFGHEFGHLQGARHDTYVDPTNTPYAYGHGYVYTADRWRTVMAYNNKCADTYPYTYCARLQYFSNPAKTYGGHPMGVAASSKNYQVLNNTKVTVANFRTSIIASDVNSNFNNAAGTTGWSAVYSSWSNSGGAYYQSLGTNGYMASAKNSGKYGDLTYTVRMKRLGSDSTRSNFLFVRGNPSALNGVKEWYSSYLFGYTNGGYFGVYRVSATGVETQLQGWTYSSAIVVGGFNTLKVIAVGSSLKYYINNVLVYSGTDSTFRTGNVGFGLSRAPASASTGNQLLVDSAVLTTTPTADVNPNADSIPAGEVIPGDTTGTFR